MERFTAQCDYDGGGFSMKVGDIVTCEQRHDGWCGGTNLRTQQKGWYPSSYVVPAMLSPPPAISSPPAPQMVIPFPAVPNSVQTQAQPTSTNSNSSPMARGFPQKAARHESTEDFVVAQPLQAVQSPPAWATTTTQDSTKTNTAGAPLQKVGQWFQQGLGQSSIGNATPPPTVSSTSTIATRSGGLFSGASSSHRLTVRQDIPSQTGAGRLAKRVGDGALMSAVWGATTGNATQIFKAAAVATTAYAVEGNERARAQKQQEEYIRQREEEIRQKELERRQKSWLKW